MKKTIKYVVTLLLIGSVFGTSCGQSKKTSTKNVETEKTEKKEEAQVSKAEGSKVETKQEELEDETEKKEINFIHPKGQTVETRIAPKEGFERIKSTEDSFLTFMRNFSLKPDGEKVMLYDGREKGNQNAHVAVFDLDLLGEDIQQCADSIIRVYGEYFFNKNEFNKIKFHLTNGFLVDYESWQRGHRLKVNGNNVTLEPTNECDTSYETFREYLLNVMVYAGTLSLDEEGTEIKLDEIEAGDMFIKGGSPGHCVLVIDIAENKNGEKSFLLAQGYMPAQEFHILKNPLHEEDPWYYASEIEYPLNTPEYTFQNGSLKRWEGFME